MPEYNYNMKGKGYALRRKTDPRLAAYINKALGSAQTILNVGAGTGSYEPEDRHVVAVEPSAVMRAQRAKHLAPAIAALAEAIPFDTGSFDAAMAVLTLHHWHDPAAGLKEMRRVARGPVVVVSFDVNDLHNFWLTEYAPEFIEIDKHRFPPIDFITDALGGMIEVTPVSIPADCIDGIQEAFFAQPEAFLDEEVRRAQSVWAHLPAGVEKRIVRSLATDLATGVWDQRYGNYRTQPSFASAMRVITSVPK